MDAKTKQSLMYAQMIQMFEDALELSGTMTITDINRNIELMSEEQAIEYIKTKVANPYTTLKDHFLELEADYEAFRNDPENIERAEQMMQMLIEPTNNGTDDDDDSTKH